MPYTGKETCKAGSLTFCREWRGGEGRPRREAIQVSGKYITRKEGVSARGKLSSDIRDMMWKKNRQSGGCSPENMTKVTERQPNKVREKGRCGGEPLQVLEITTPEGVEGGIKNLTCHLEGLVINRGDRPKRRRVNKKKMPLNM